MSRYNADRSDKKTIQLSMILLFLALLVIYILLFSINGEQFKTDLESNTTSLTNTTDTTNGNREGDREIISYTTTGTQEISLETNNEDIIITDTSPVNTGELDEYAALEDTINSSEESGTTSGINNQLDNADDIYILSGTEKYYGPIKIIEKLGIKYQFALKDDKDIYYIYLGDYEYDFDTLARLRSGNVYKMTEQAILENNLFGEEISFINLADYQNQTVIMLIKVSGEQRLLQIDYTIYHKSKDYLKSIFGY